MKKFDKGFVLGVLKEEKDKRLVALEAAHIKASEKTPESGRQTEIDKITRRRMEVVSLYRAYRKRFEGE